MLKKQTKLNHSEYTQRVLWTVNELNGEHLESKVQNLIMENIQQFYTLSKQKDQSTLKQLGINCGLDEGCAASLAYVLMEESEVPGMYHLFVLSHLQKVV